METKKPLESVGWLGGSSHRIVINEAARREAEMKPWSTRIPAAIAKGEELLDGRDGWFPQLPLSEPITVGEVALAAQLWKTELFVQELKGKQPPPPSLIAFCEKIERLNHD